MNTIFHKDAGKQRTNGENLHVENDSNHVNGVESNEESGENRPSENGKGDENETKNIAESESDTITKVILSFPLELFQLSICVKTGVFMPSVST